jgi:hypothetical protein
MSRRSRKPGPLKEESSSPAQNFRTQVPQTNPWITVNVYSGGALPTDLDTVTSDDIDNGTPGTWYYYDPNSTIDLTANSNVWITQDANGIQFEGVNLAKVDDSGNKLSIVTTNFNAGRIATALMKPDGSGQFTFADLIGASVEFLIERHEVSPHAENHEIGLWVALGKNTMMSSATSAAYGLGSCYFGTSASDAGANGFLFNPQNNSASTSADGRKIWGMHHFSQKDADEVICGYSTMKLLDENDHQHQNTSQSAQQKGTRTMGTDDKVYLAVGVFARDTSGNGSAVRRSAKWRIWYRLNWDPIRFDPDYVLQGDNHNSGSSSGR